MKKKIIIAIGLAVSMTAGAQCCHQQTRQCQPLSCDSSAVCQPAQRTGDCANQQQCGNPQSCGNLAKQTCDEVNPHTLIISYDGKKGKARLLKAVKNYGAEIIYNYKNFNCIAIGLPKDNDANDAISYFSKVKGVTSVERDRIMHTN